MDIQKHPILKKLYELSLEIENLGASPSFTALTDMVEEISKDTEQFIDTSLEMIKDAGKLVEMSDWTILAEKEPGIEYLDPEEVKRGCQNSTTMVVVVNTNPEKSFYFARWNYEFGGFLPDDSSNDVCYETINYHTKLWKPLPLVTDEKWMRSFPRIQMSQDKSYEDEILLGQQLELESDEE